MTFLKNPPSYKTLRAKWPGGSRRKASSSTDNIPSPTDKGTSQASVVRHPTDPIDGGGPRESEDSLVSLSTILQEASVFGGLEMSARATITFSRPGVQPPVFVVTSVSTPPWEVLEMAVSDKKTDSGDTIFHLQLDGVAHGRYEYKIRIGDSNWTIDESKETSKFLPFRIAHGDREATCHDLLAAFETNTSRRAASRSRARVQSAL